MLVQFIVCIKHILASLNPPAFLTTSKKKLGGVWQLYRLLCLLFVPPVNVGEDCPVFDGMYEFCQLSAGGSLGGFWGDRL